MVVIIHFERSESFAAHLGIIEDERISIPFNLDDGQYVQLTYDSLRRQDGSILARFDDDYGWDIDDPAYCGPPFSDIVIEFTDSPKEV